MSRLVVAVAVVCMVAGAACGPPAPVARPVIAASPVTASLLANVPADTPYVMATIEPWAPVLVSRMLRQADAELARFVAAHPPSADETPLVRAGRAFYDEVRGRKDWSAALGLAPSGRFVVYGLSLWPVMRLELADPARLRAVVEHVTTAAGLVLETHPLAGGTSYWSAATGDYTIVAAVLAREAVVALVPTASLATSVPRVLGLEPPARSLADAHVLDDVRRAHGLGGAFVGVADVREIVAILTARGHGWNGELAGALGGTIHDACVADFDRLAAVAPRVAYGYRRFDAGGFSASLIAETPALVTAALAQLRVAVPEVTTTPVPDALGSFGVAVNGDKLLALLGRLAGAVQAHPFACAQLAELNTSATSLSALLGNALPPMFTGLRGLSIVVDDAQRSPPGGAGHMMIVGAHVVDLVTATIGKIPGMSGIAIAATGLPTALPLAQFGLPGLTSAHLVINGERAALAVGPNSASGVLASISAPVPAHSPLMTISYDVVRIRERFPSFASDSKLASLASMRNVTMRLDVRDDGVAIDMEGGWADR